MGGNEMVAVNTASSFKNFGSERQEEKREKSLRKLQNRERNPLFYPQKTFI